MTLARPEKIILTSELTNGQRFMVGASLMTFVWFGMVATTDIKPMAWRFGPLQHALASTDALDFDSETTPAWFGLSPRFARYSGSHESTGCELTACVRPEPFDTVRRHGFVWKQTIFLVWPLFEQ